MLTTCSFSKVGFSYLEIMKRRKKGSGICTFLHWIEHTSTCSMSRLIAIEEACILHIDFLCSVSFELA